MGYLGGGFITPQATFVEDQFEGDGTTTDFTLSETIASDAGALVFIQGALQDTNEYTITGRTCSFSSAPADGTLIRVRYSRREVTMYLPDASVGRDQLTQDAKDQAEGDYLTSQSLSGTSVDFTSIPSWVRSIRVGIVGWSTNGTSDVIIQLGDSGGIETTGYVSEVSNTVDIATATAGIVLVGATVAAGSYNSIVHLTAVDPSGNVWLASVNSNRSGSNAAAGSGSKTLTATLDRIRITTENGTDTFDAGTAYVRYDR